MVSLGIVTGVVCSNLLVPDATAKISPVKARERDVYVQGDHDGARRTSPTAPGWALGSPCVFGGDA